MGWVWGMLEKGETLLGCLVEDGNYPTLGTWEQEQAWEQSDDLCLEHSKGKEGTHLSRTAKRKYL